jgi:solute carrier family 23 (nucleobase transporter), member 1
VAAAPWLRDPATLLLPWGTPRFHLGFFLATLAGYLASTLESFGDYFAVARAAGEPEPTPRQIDRGIGAEGIGCFVTGLLGGFASTSYSENIGLVALTRVASRRVVYDRRRAPRRPRAGRQVRGGGGHLPGPVVGGLYCTLFGLISAVGLSIAARADLTSQRNLLIIGFSLFMGLSVPAWVAGVPAMGFPPAEISIPAAPWLADMIRAVGSTGMAVAAILGLLLDNLIPGTREERGLAA